MRWNKIDIAIGRLSWVRCTPNWRLDWSADWLKDFDLWFVWAGEGKATLADGRTVPLHPGVCLWQRPGRTYRAVHNPKKPLGVTYIHFDLRERGRRIDPGPIPEVHLVENLPYFDAATRRVVELVRFGRPERRLEAETLLRSLLIGLASGGELAGPRLPVWTEHQRRIRAIIAEIVETGGTQRNVAQLAAKAGYGAAHFSRVFRAVTGTLPQEFLINVRIDRAKQLLRESSLSIGEIADALGYADVFFFSRQFRERAGTSPSAFRLRPD